MLNEPESNYAIPRLYFCDNDEFEVAKNVKPYVCGEIEMISKNDRYVLEPKLNDAITGHGMERLGTSSPK